MAINPRSGKISDMDSLPVITGTEYLEVVSKEIDGTYRNYRINVGDIRTNVGHSAYQTAILNGFVGTEQEWLDTLGGKSIYTIAVEQGFVGTEAEFLLTLKGTNGKSAFELAVENGFSGTLSEFMLTLKGADGQRGADGKSAFAAAAEGGYAGTEEEFGLALGKLDEPVVTQISGAVFIRNVTPVNPADNVGNKVYANDEKTLLSCSSTTRNVTVHLDAVTGYTSYKPEVKLGGTPVVLSVNPANELIWKGQMVVENITLDGSGRAILEFLHNDGAKGSVTIVSDVAPVVTRAVFTGTYPGSQTELKMDDKVSIEFSADTDIVGYEIRNSGALKAATGTVDAGPTHSVINLPIADRGNVAQDLPFEIRVRKAGGAWSEWYSSAIGGATDFVNVVKLNNLRPSIVVNSVTYPGVQTAIKGDDTATVNYTLNNYTGSISVSPIGTMLEVTSIDENAAVVKLTPTATSSNGNNLTITLSRSDNGSTTSATASIVIANEAPKIVITVPAARLRSGGAGDSVAQLHTITVTASQPLVAAPTLDASIGTWDSAAWVGNPAKTVWTRKLVINDTDPKGAGVFSNFVAESTAGIATTVITTGANYVAGGFVRRVLQVAAWANRTVAIGTMVTDVTKLLCSNLSKGQVGSYNTQYKEDDANMVNKYTIKNGNTWYNCDVANATSNTQGSQYIEIEETV